MAPLIPTQCNGDCTNGVCKLCPAGQWRCADGCVNQQNDNHNCGGCGNSVGFACTLAVLTRVQCRLELRQRHL
jgi:hypothetical protein